jgi:hypothetical protein
MEGSRWELSNGLLGIIIPQNIALARWEDGKVLAPIQSIVYEDGNYSDESPNYLVTTTLPVKVNLSVQKLTAEEVIIIINYSYKKSKYKDNARDTARYLNDEGPGYYRTTIVMKKGRRSVLIEEESNYDIYYSVKISNGLNPDKARYRGWFAYTAGDGYEPDGSVYKGEDARGGHNIDATVDLNFKQYTQYRRMSLWEVAGGEVNTGRYWQFYNSRAAETANLLGIFQGRASRLLGGNFGGIQLVVKQEQGKQFAAELAMTLTRKAPDLTWMPRRRFQWGLFVSSKKDLLSPEKIQPIGIELNRVSGLAEKIDGYASKNATPHPSFFDGAIYLPASQIQELIRKVKSDQETYKKIAALDPYFKPVLDAWRSPLDAKELIKALILYGEKLKENFKTGDGSFSFDVRYWKGAMRFQQTALQISCIFADKSILLSALQKEQLLQVVRMMARIVWDNNHVPMFDSSEVNYGNGNMYLQYNNNGRSFFSLLFASDPEFSARARNIAKETRKQIRMAIYESGASFSSPHYSQAAIDPLLQVMLQLKQAGINDLFIEENRIRKFADFYSSLLTPPSVRFSGNRKLVSFGDGSEESAVTFALLGSGFKSFDKTLSDRMYNLYERGPRRPGQFVYIALLFDLLHFHDSQYISGTSNYTGYLSNLRSAVNSENETVVWFLTGDSLIDHRHDDRGDIAIYALKAPLSLRWSSLYYPHANGPFVRSVIVPITRFSEWKSIEQPIGKSDKQNWHSASPLEFVRLGKSATSIALMNADKKWKRQVSLLTISEKHPVIIIKDSISDPGPNIWSMLFMSQGDILTPAGRVTPPKRKHDNAGFKEFPAASAETEIKSGWNTFQFSGQDWSKQLHPSGGIDWYLYSFNRNNTTFTTSEWSNFWQNDIESREFEGMYKKPYEESQQILRIKGGSQFFTVILPYNKDEDIHDNVQTEDKGKLTVPVGNKIVTLSENYYYFESGSTMYFGSLNTNAVSEKGYSIIGGFAEVEKNENTLIIRIHGNTGVRFVQLPFKVEQIGRNNEVSVSEMANSSRVVIKYKNNDPSLLSTQKGYMQYVFKVK